jgi:hypothetical protein
MNNGEGIRKFVFQNHETNTHAIKKTEAAAPMSMHEFRFQEDLSRLVGYAKSYARTPLEDAAGAHHRLFYTAYNNFYRCASVIKGVHNRLKLLKEFSVSCHKS